MSDGPVLPGLDPEVRKRVVTVEIDTEHVHKMRHRAVIDGRFEFFSDEPPPMDGDDDEPYPLHYFAAGIGL